MLNPVRDGGFIEQNLDRVRVIQLLGIEYTNCRVEVGVPVKDLFWCPSAGILKMIPSLLDGAGMCMDNAYSLPFEVSASSFA